MSGTKIKICGLSRPCDAGFVNRAAPDYAGFVFCERSRRNVSAGQARALREAVSPSIRTVGVFVNAAPEQIIPLYREGIISIIQLHGSEDDGFIARLRDALPGAEIWKAFQVRTPNDLDAAKACTADRVLLDSGGGTGARFDWSLIGRFPRPFLLAGGLTPENIPDAIFRLHPYGVDVSSGVEAGGVKDEGLICAAVAAARGGDMGYVMADA